MSGLSWSTWSTEPFQRAHAGGKPVLLSIVAGWSAACREMDAEVFAAPAVAAAVQAHAVPVRVDADLRPDIADRYGLGGWPTTVWLTPDGEMLSGGTYVDAETLIATLGDVASRFQRDRAALVQQAGAARAARRQQQARAATAAAAAAESKPMTLDAIRERVLHEFDAEHGGFGQGAQFPTPAPILFALRAGVHAQDADLIAVAETTLDRMAESALSDPVTGAFHRACAQRDWTDPDPACLLDVQADLITVYLEAWRLLHHDHYRSRALRALEFVDRQLRDPERGAFRHFEGGHILTDSNARLMRTLVHASNVLGDTRWILAAIDIAEHLLPVVYARASGVAHHLRPAAAAPQRGVPPGIDASPSVGAPPGIDARRGIDVRPGTDAAADAPSDFRPTAAPSNASAGVDPIGASGLLSAGAGASGARARFGTSAAGRDQPMVFGLSGDAILMAAGLLDLGEAAGQQVYLELAEELMRSCIRRFWEPGSGAFVDRIRTTAGAGDVGLLGEGLFSFGGKVEGARMLGRLGGLTQDAALVSHARDALRFVGVAACREGILSSDYGLLLLELGRNSA